MLRTLRSIVDPVPLAALAAREYLRAAADHLT
jgi:hypothetical protein